jgi:hypothetical protein
VGRGGSGEDNRRGGFLQEFKREVVYLSRVWVWDGFGKFALGVGYGKCLKTQGWHPCFFKQKERRREK